MALLIFPPDNLAPQLAGLLDPILRQTVAADVNRAILQELDHRGQARLQGLVKLRAWAERRAREKKIPMTAEGLDLWGLSQRDERSQDGEDTFMGGNGE